MGLAVAVLTGVGTATRYLDQAGWSQRQSAAVLAIEAAVLGGLAWRALAGANRRLERLVAVRTQEADARAERLADIDRSRRLFFAKLSHELRTPVTVLRGEAEVALRIDDDAGALRDALGHVVASAGYLERRLEELPGERIGGGRAVDAGCGAVRSGGGPVRAVTVQAGPFARSSATRLDVAVPEGPVPVMGDARWIRRAVLELVANSVKFSSEYMVLEV